MLNFQMLVKLSTNGTNSKPGRLICVDECFKEFLMGSTSDKLSGAANKAAGNVRQAAGKATGSKEMQAKGKMQEMKGEAQ
jgi:hypothetical protein